MTDEKNLKSELEELRGVTEELREVRDNLDGSDFCDNCRKYAAIAYRTAERYYEMLIRAEIIETTWYKKGGINCDHIDCDAKQEVEKLKRTLDAAKKNLSNVIDTSFNPKKDDDK